MPRDVRALLAEPAMPDGLALKRSLHVRLRQLWVSLAYPPPNYEKAEDRVRCVGLPRGLRSTV